MSLEKTLHRSTDVSGSPKRRGYAEVLVANTWRCNLKCTYCFVDHHLHRTARDDMTPAVSARVVDSLDAGLRDVETICIHLYGGEPLLNLPAIRAMVDRASTKPPGRFAFAVTTNGTHVSSEVFDLLNAGRFYVILSIDGPKHVHDSCRRTRDGGPSHATVIRFLKTLKERTECQVWGSAVIRSGWGLIDATAYLRTLPIDAIKAQAIRAANGSPLALSAAERKEYLHHLDVIGHQVIEALESGWRPLDHRFTSRVFQLLTKTDRSRYCNAGITGFGITPHGTVLGCILLDAGKNRLGHIDDHPSAWRNAGARWVRTAKRLPECDGCSALPLCGGGCPAINPICGESECEIVRKNCDVAKAIHHHFQSRPEALLGLAGLF